MKYGKNYLIKKHMKNFDNNSIPYSYNTYNWSSLVNDYMNMNFTFAKALIENLIIVLQLGIFFRFIGWNMHILHIGSTKLYTMWILSE